MYYVCHVQIKPYNQRSTFSHSLYPIQKENGCIADLKVLTR